jgi:hypothetical protein
MTRRLPRALLAATSFAFGVTASAYAGPVVFNFNSLADGANNTAIQTYMDGLLTGGASVTVYSGASASRTYTGDGHVVGPTNGSGVTTSLTLGNTEGLKADSTNGTSANATAGAADTFLINNNTSGTGNSAGDRIVMSFNNFTIAAGSTISYDYEIFPNGTCPGGAGGCSGGVPTFTFAINGTTDQTFTGVAPASSALYYKNSPTMTGETAPQALGTAVFTVTSALVNPTLAFIDWPVTIGVDNLTITPPVTTTAGAPEPATLVLFGTGAVALLRRRRRLN